MNLLNYLGFNPDSCHQILQNKHISDSIIKQNGVEVDWRYLTLLFSSILKSVAGNLEGRVVAVFLPNNAECIITYLAVCSNGAILLPVNPRLNLEEIRSILLNSTTDPVRLIIGPNSFSQDKLFDIQLLTFTMDFRSREISINIQVEPANLFDHQFVDSKPQDHCIHLFTSGTTAKPKEIRLTHQQCVASAENIANTYKWKPYEDITYVLMPLFHVHGLMAGCISPLAKSTTICFGKMGRFSLSVFWDEIELFKPTWLTAVPSIWQIILTHFKPNCLKLRFARSASSPLPIRLAEDLEKAIQAPVLEAYGMTEACHQISSNTEYSPRIRNSVGTPIGVQVVVLDENDQDLPNNTIGEVCIRGENVIQKYYSGGTPESFAHCPQPKYWSGINSKGIENRKFLRTGDVGFIDDNQAIHLIGRIKEIINRGGEKISPFEIEEVFLRDPRISQVAAFSTPDPVLGEAIEVAVVLKENISNSAEELRDIKSTAESHLSSFKVNCF